MGRDRAEYVDNGLAEFFRTQGRETVVPSNDSVMLDQPDQVHLILSGRAEVFAQSFLDGQAQGARSHLFSVEPGDLLFGVKPKINGPEELRLICVGLEDLSISRLPADVWEGQASAGELSPLICQGANRFMIKLGRGITRTIFPKPRRTVDAAPGQPMELAPGDVVQPPHGLVWLTDLTGPAGLFLDQEEATVSIENPFPVPNGCWLTTAGRCSAGFASTEQVAKPGRLHQAMAPWLELCLQCLDRNNRLDMVDALNSIRDKKEADREYISEAVTDLASVLKRDHDRIATSGSPQELHRIMAMVGDGAGCEFNFPANGRSQPDSPAEIAERSGVFYRRINLENGWWRNVHEPLLVFEAENNRPLAVTTTTGNRFMLVDADGARQPLSRRSARKLGNVAYSFQRPMTGRTVDRHDLSGQAVKGLKSDFINLSVAALGSALLGLVLPLAAKSIFSSIIPTADRTRLIALTAAVVGAVVASALLKAMIELTCLRIEALAEVRLEAALWDRLLRLPLRFFSKYSAGNLASRSGAFQRARELMSAGMLTGLLTGFYSSTSLILLFFLAPAPACAAVGLIALQGLVACRLTRGRLDLLRQASGIRSRLAGLVLQFISGLTQLRASGAEPRAFARWSRDFTRQRSKQHQAFKRRIALRVFNKGFRVLSLVVIFLLFNRREGVLDSGTFLAFYVAFGILQTGVDNLVAALSQATGLIPQLERVRPILNQPPEESPVQLAPMDLEGRIEATSLSFRYGEQSPLVLDNVSFSVSPGQFVALVGPSGSGKSTLLRLLIGLESPDSGSIIYDGRDLCELKTRLLRRQMGVVLQDFGILPGTIRQAVTGSREASEERIWAAAEAVGLAPAVRGMERGLETMLLRNGDNLSGGQRQQLALARVIFHDPAVVILDEATSALDNRTQSLVMTSLESLKSTRVVAAQRLSTIRNADRILVLDNGRLVEEGDYDQLMARRGLFHSMAARQVAE